MILEYFINMLMLVEIKGHKRIEKHQQANQRPGETKNIPAGTKKRMKIQLELDLFLN